MKSFLHRSLTRLGYGLYTRNRFGVNPVFDIQRLCGTQPPRTVFDVGANVGQTAHQFHDAFPAARIFSFEPAPSTFDQLRANTAALPRVTCVDAALGAEAGHATLHLADVSIRNSLRQPAALTSESIRVCVRTLDEYCGEVGVDRIDLLKVDVEGFEWEVLRGGTALLDAGRVRFLFLEANFAPVPEVPQSDFAVLLEHLRPYGFCVAGIYGEAFWLRTGSLACNVLFAHRPSLPATVAGRVQNITAAVHE